MASSWSTSQASGKGLACKNRGSISYRSVVLSSPHPHPNKTYWAGKPSTLTTRLAEQVKSREETSPTDFLFRAFGTQAVVRTISNPHQIVVRIRPTFVLTFSLIGLRGPIRGLKAITVQM